MKRIIKIVLLLFSLSASNTTFFSRISEIIAKGNWINLLIFLFLCAASVLGLFAAAFHPQKTVRRGVGILFFISTLFGLTYLSISNHFLNFEDMELLWISRAFASEALSFYLSFLYVPLGVSLSLFIGVILSFDQKKMSFKNQLITFIVAILPFIMFSAVSYKTGGYGTKSMPMHYSSLSTFSLFLLYNELSPGMNDRRSEVTIPFKSDHSVKKIVFIVDESIRADYVNFSGASIITPYLSKHSDRFIDFGITSSGNNCSGYSNAILRMGGIKSKLSNIGHGPMIWNYARKAGYKNYYIDGQLKNGELQNFMSGDELKNIDEFFQVNDGANYNVDHKIAKKLKMILAKDEKTFVYINKRGAHFPYNDCYDTKAPRFKPQMSENEKIGENKERFINSYKNAVYWNVDQFFKELLNGVNLKNTLIFYTSDHGQNLMDRGLMTHCNSVDPFPFEGYVPTTVITENLELKSKYRNYLKKSKNKLTHFEFFSTIIQEMGYESKEVKSIYGNGFEGPIKTKQEFSAGGVLPRFGRRVQWHTIYTK